jgi:hypothetical protein
MMPGGEGVLAGLGIATILFLAALVAQATLSEEPRGPEPEPAMLFARECILIASAIALVAALAVGVWAVRQAWME